MTRLIDADALIDCFEMRGDSDLGWHLYEVIDEINDAPTAYELGKVVEELEEYGDRFSSENYDDWYAAGVVSDCEEIVKRGGIDEID